MRESRVHKSLLNAKTNLIFYLIFVLLSFFSRKIFLENLGADFMGLSGTLSNILGLLSLAEMGVSAAISYSLYKPLERGDKETIKEIVSVLGYMYQKIGLIILFVAFVVSLFLPLIFNDTIFDLSLIFLAYYSLLISVLLGYFLNYKQILLTADQKGYVVTGYLQGVAVVKVILQMLFAYYWKSFYAWIYLELFFSFLACVILNRRIRRTYPWLDTNVSEGRKLFERHKKIITFTKKVFVHKIKDFLSTQSDQIFIYAFVSLKMVAFYGNYILIVSKVSSAFDYALNSFNAGIGHLVAEGNKDNNLCVFWELVSIRFIVAGFLIFSIFNFMEPFILLWLGNQYILDRTILFLLMINIFIMQTRGAVDVFNTAYGHYADTWSAWVELTINITVTIIAAPFWGIAGILFGKIASTILVVIIWKPYYLFKIGFKKRISLYWKMKIRYYIAFILSLFWGNLLIGIIPFDEKLNFSFFAMKISFCLFLYMVMYIVLLLLLTQGTRFLFKRILNICRQ